MGARVDRPIVVAQLTSSLGLGGTERQVIEHLRRMDPRYSPRLMCLRKEGAFIQDARALGLEPEEFNLRGGLAQPNTVRQIARMVRRLREERAQLLHCHDLYSNFIGSAAARLAGIPYIASRRDLGLDRPWKLRAALTLVTRAAPRVLCNSTAVAALVRREGTPAERVTVVVNGIDLTRFDREAAQPAPSDIAFSPEQPTVVFVGNMQQRIKGHAGFLLAAAEVARAIPAVRFLFIGDGVLRAGLEQKARQLGLGDKTLFAGWRTDVPAILARADVAVSASFMEGLPNAIMEAMAARLPVVATDVGGSAELVREGESGYLVPSGDAGRMAARLIDVLKAFDARRAMGAKGRQRIEAAFSAELLGARMAALYDGLLGVTPPQITSDTVGGGRVVHSACG